MRWNGDRGGGGGSVQCSSGFLAKSGNCNASGSSGCNIRFFRAEVINVISRMYGFSFGTRVILIRKVSLKKKWSSFVGGLLSFVTCLIAVTLLNSVVAWLARLCSSIAPVEFVKSQNYMLRIPKSHKSCLLAAVFCHLDSKFKFGIPTDVVFLALYKHPGWWIGLLSFLTSWAWLPSYNSQQLSTRAWNGI